ncbi:hypothetical protein AXG94_24455 [Pseudomonas corrugata]|nr:hypothetical protein AXG94_24455 [Pseudomonas corrugata]
MVVLQTLRSAQAAQCSALDKAWRRACMGFLARFKQKKVLWEPSLLAMAMPASIPVECATAIASKLGSHKVLQCL